MYNLKLSNTELSTYLSQLSQLLKNINKIDKSNINKILTNLERLLSKV